MNIITMPINPDIFHIGSFTIAWHGVFTALAVLTGILVPARLARSRGLSADRVYDIALWAVPGGIVGARLVHVIDYWSFYTANPGRIIAINEGGLAIWGAILGGVITGVAYARIKKLPVLQYMDVIAFGLVLAQAVGRIGDVINGEHIASASNLPWAFVYSHPNSPSFGLAPQHPAVLYELLMDMGILGLLWWQSKRPWPAGSLFFIYFSAYSLGRFLLSFLRTDKEYLGLTEAQIISLVGLLVGVGFLVYLYLRPPSHAAETARPEPAEGEAAPTGGATRQTRTGKGKAR